MLAQPEPISELRGAKKRILDAAIQRFGSNSYEGTGLRDIASDAGADLAYVQRSFGSKEGLFTSALRAVLVRDLPVRADAGDLARFLSQQFVEDRRDGEVQSFDIVSRSFSSPEAARVMLQVLSSDFLEPLLSIRPDLKEKDVVLTLSLLLGVRVMRDIIKAPILSQTPPEELRGKLFELLTGILAPKR